MAQRTERHCQSERPENAVEGVDRRIAPVILKLGQGLRRQFAHLGERVLVQSGDFEAQAANCNGRWRWRWRWRAALEQEQVQIHSVGLLTGKTPFQRLSRSTSGDDVVNKRCKALSAGARPTDGQIYADRGIEAGVDTFQEIDQVVRGLCSRADTVPLPSQDHPPSAPGRRATGR